MNNLYLPHQLLSLLLLTVSSALAQTNEEEAIKRVIQQETQSFETNNHEAWSNFWVHEPYIIWIINQMDGGYKKVTGWDELSKTIKFYMSRQQTPTSPPNIKQRKYVVRQNGTMAFVTYEVADTSDDGSIEHTQGTRILEKKGNDWKLIYSSVFIPWNEFTIVNNKTNPTKFQTGTYTLTTSPNKTAITYSDDGKYIVKRAGEVIAEGTYKVDGNLIEVTDLGGARSCTGTTGKYKWILNGKAMTFVRVDDLCNGRLISFMRQGWMLE